MRRLVIVALCTAAGTIHADPAPVVHAGPQAAPPVVTGEPVLSQDVDARHNVRGCAVGETCTRASEVLREFEVEAFPPPGASPWLDERTGPASRLEANAPRKIRKPSELRPDQPWL